MTASVQAAQSPLGAKPNLHILSFEPQFQQNSAIEIDNVSR